MQNVRHILIEDDSDDRALALRELKKEKKYYHNFVRSLNDWVWETDVSGIHTYSNPAVKSILGYKVDEVVGQHITTLWLDEAKTRKNLKWLKKTLAEGKGWKKIQGRFKHKNGSTVITESTAIPIFDSKNKLIGYRGVDRDITEYKRSEDALRKSEEKYRKIVEGAPDGIVTVDLQGIITSCNSAFLKLTGYPKKDIVGVHFQKLPTSLKEDLPEYQKLFKSILHGNKIKPMKFRWKHRKGTVRICEAHVTLMKKGGKPESFQIIMRDITERKKAENALRESKNRLNIIFESAPDAYYLNDFEGTFIDGNKAAEELLGYSREELIGKNFADAGILPMDQVERAFNLLAKNINGEPTGPDEFTLKRKDGTKVDVEILTHPVKIGGEDRVLGIARDITDRKKVKKALKESNRLFRLITDNMEDEIWLMDMDMNVTYITPSVYRYRGYSLEDMRKMDWIEHLAPESLEVAIKALELALTPENLSQKDREVTGTCDLEFYCRDGSTVWSETTIKLLRDVNGKPSGLLGSAHDITERKQAEDALRESEARIRALLNAPTDAMILIDSAGIVLAVNNTHAEWFKKSVDEIIGKCVFDLFPPDTAEFRKTQTNKVFNTGNPIHFEESRNGKVFFTNVYPVFDVKGKVTAVAVYIQDITERKQAEEARYESEEKYRRLVDNLFDVVLEADKDGNITYASPQITDLFGFKPEEVIGKNVFEFMHPDDIENAMEVMAEALKCEKMIRVEYRTRHKDGHYIPIFGSAKIVREGDDFKIISVVRDITERKQSEEQLEKYREHLEELVKQRTEQLEDTNTELESFAYSVSHDLRAPLRGMQGFAHALLEDYGDKLDDKGREYANRIIDSSVHMNTIIEDLLAYSRLSRAELGLKPVSLGKALNEALEPLERRIRERSVKLKVEPNLPKVKAHSTTLQKVIYNLILNAITFVDEDAKPKIKIWAVEHKNKVRLYVKDNGIGIAPQYHDKIFGIFERLHGIETYPGTGIGLAIVRKGMERMEGTYGLESELGKGSTFWIELAKEGIKNG